MVNAAIYKFLDDKKSGLKYLAIILVVVGVVLGYGYFRINQKLSSDSLRVSVIQGNIPQDEKWQYELAPFILGRHMTLSRLASEEKPDIIIWPETSLPGALEEDQFLIENINFLAKDIKTKLLIGAVS